MRIAALVFVLGCTIVTSARAAEHASWAAYTKANRYKCPGPLDTFKGGRTLTLGSKTYRHTGYKLEVQDADTDNAITVGVLSAIKDASPETKKNLTRAFAAFKERDVEWIIVNGDVSLDEDALEGVFDALGSSGFPTLVIIGNAESKGSYSRVFTQKEKAYPNLVNGVWVRQVIADDLELWTVPGYYDAEFVRQGAGCVYGKADIAVTEKLVPAGKAPVALVSHGPPRGNGKGAIDWMNTEKNVGDPELTRLLQAQSIHFGFFGHILEAGGSAVGADMTLPVAPKRDVADLFVNVGSASAVAENLNDGSTSHGLAMVIVIADKKARYELLRLDQLKP